jgi:cytochrome P450
MKKSEFNDPFEEARAKEGIGHMNDQDDPVVMVLGHKDVRKCAHNWKTFQSAAKPGRIVIPSEVNLRDTRQLPFELDPPEHTDLRDFLNPWFKRALNDDYQASLRSIIVDLIDSAMSKDKIEIVEEFSLLLQSRALTLLLNTPYEESETWISWGVHVFRSEEHALDRSKADFLNNYIDEQITKAIAQPGEDLYSVLLDAEINGKKMTREEVKGVMQLTFAGGRDTVINALTNTIAYFSDHPESLARIKNEPEIRVMAVEELVRYFAPLTQMGRVATEDTTVCEHAVKADTRISMCWASANRDATVFENPNEVILDRKTNPHVSFGFGRHNCLGATHIRQILQIFIELLSEKVSNIDLISCEENIEKLGKFNRKVGYDSLTVKFNK